MAGVSRLLARGRRRAEALMVDACIVDRVTGSTVDPDTGAEVPTYTTVYDGPCRVQSRNTATTSPNTGEQRVDLLTLEVQLPVDASAGLAVSDRVRITSSVHDPDLPSRTFRVENLAHKSHATSRRVSVEERTS